MITHAIYDNKVDFVYNFFYV